MFLQGFDIEVATLEVRVANTKYNNVLSFGNLPTLVTKIGVANRKVAIGCNDRRLILKTLVIIIVIDI